jgi:D-xylose transport system substrate-binding protein
MKKLKVSIILSVLFVAVGCGGHNNAVDSSDRPEAGGKVKIGFAMDTLREERWQRDHDAFLAACNEFGVECVVNVADNKAEKQADNVENLLTQGVDVLVIAPSNATQAASLVERAKSQGVPVISYDRLINSDKIDLYISHQVPVIGQRIAEYALSNAPTGNYIMVYGSSTDNNALIMEKAQLEVLEKAINSGAIKIAAQQFIQDWDPNLAQNFVENALTKINDDVQAVVASNDGMAGGAVQALERKGLVGKVIVTGQDAQIDALQRIAEGKQSMTIYKAIIPLARGAVEAAIKLSRKEALETEMFMNAAIGKEVPAILLQVVTVTKDNLMDTVIKDGYARFEDVYRNVPENERPRR